MIDIQSQHDNREVPLKKVGIKGLRYPVQVLDKANGTQKTSGVVDLFVNLPKHFKGTHMSRFVEIFHAYHTDLSMKQFLAMLEQMRIKLEAEQAFGTRTFPFFLETLSNFTKFRHYSRIKNDLFLLIHQMTIF